MGVRFSKPLHSTTLCQFSRIISTRDMRLSAWYNYLHVFYLPKNSLIFCDFINAIPFAPTAPDNLLPIATQDIDCTCNTHDFTYNPCLSFSPQHQASFHIAMTYRRNMLWHSPTCEQQSTGFEASGKCWLRSNLYGFSVHRFHQISLLPLCG